MISTIGVDTGLHSDMPAILVKNLLLDILGLTDFHHPVSTITLDFHPKYPPEDPEVLHLVDARYVLTELGNKHLAACQ